MENDFVVYIEFINEVSREQAAYQAIAFAKKFDIGVKYNFGGATIVAWPTSSLYALEEQYKEYTGDFANDWRCKAPHLGSD